MVADQAILTCLFPFNLETFRMNASTKPSQVHHLQSPPQADDAGVAAKTRHVLREEGGLNLLSSKVVVDAIDESREFVSKFNTRQQGE